MSAVASEPTLARRVIVWIEFRPVSSFLLCFVPFVVLLLLLNDAVEQAPRFVHHDAIALTYRVRTYSPVESDSVYGKRTTLAALARNGFARVTTGDDWQLLWTLNPQTRFILPVADEENIDGHMVPSATREHQTGATALRPRIHNHCFYFLAAGQKCQFASHLVSLRRKLGELNAMDSHLDVYRWRISDDQTRFLRLFNSPTRPMFVKKACTLSRGRGIEFVRRPRHGTVTLEDPMFPPANGSFVFQRNIDSPMLLDGHKFHVRVFVLVTSYNPVRVSLFDEGLVFKAFKKIDGATEADRDALLSNRAVSGSQSDNYLSWLWTRVGPERSAHMRVRIRRALTQLIALYVPVSASLQHIAALDVYPFDWRVTADIDAHSNSTENKLGCFDLFGVDIMFDDADNPAILEINAGPSMDSPALPVRLDGSSAAPDDDDEDSYTAHDATFDANNAVKRRMLTNVMQIARRHIEGVRVERTKRDADALAPALTYDVCVAESGVGSTRFCALLRRFRDANCASKRTDMTLAECEAELASLFPTLYHYREHANHRATPHAPHFDWFPDRAEPRPANGSGAVNGFAVVYPLGDDVDTDMYNMWASKRLTPFSSLDQVQMEWAQFLQREDRDST